jgi:hypothetical protein
MFQSLEELAGVSIGILAVGGAFFIAAWAVYHSQKTKRMMIERGITREPEKTEQFSPLGSLRRGLTTLAVGLAFLVAYFLHVTPVEWAFLFVGVLLSFLGIAYLVLAGVFKGSQKTAAT